MVLVVMLMMIIVTRIMATIPMVATLAMVTATIMVTTMITVCCIWQQVLSFFSQVYVTISYSAFLCMAIFFHLFSCLLKII